MSLVQAFHNIFVDKYCLMYTEDNILTLAVVFRKNEVIKRRKSIVKWKDNTLRKHQVVVKQKFLEKYFKHGKKLIIKLSGLHLIIK